MTRVYIKSVIGRAALFAALPLAFHIVSVLEVEQ